jgi:hypothetical protein
LDQTRTAQTRTRQASNARAESYDAHARRLLRFCHLCRVQPGAQHTTLRKSFTFALGSHWIERACAGGLLGFIRGLRKQRCGFARVQRLRRPGTRRQSGQFTRCNRTRTGSKDSDLGRRVALRIGSGLRKGDLACAIEAGLRGRLRWLRRGGCLVVCPVTRKDSSAEFWFSGSQRNGHVVSLRQTCKRG